MQMREQHKPAPSVEPAGRILGRKRFPPGAKPRIVLYDFKRPDKFSRDQIRTFAVVHETFARLATTAYGTRLRTDVRVHLQGVDQMTYGESTAQMPPESVLAIVNMDPLKGSSLLQVERQLVDALIDRLFGGPGEATSSTKRAEGCSTSSAESDGEAEGDAQVASEQTDGVQLTDLEKLVLVRWFGEILLRNLGEAWSVLLEASFRMGSIETVRQFVQIVPPAEMVVVAEFDVAWGKAKGKLHLVVPFLTIEPLLGKLSYPHWCPPRPGSPNEQVADLRVPAVVYRLTEPLSIEMLGTLSEGQMLPLANTAEACLEVGGQAVLELEEDDSGPDQYRVAGRSAARGAADSAAGIVEWLGTSKDTVAESAAVREPFEAAIAEVRASMSGISEEIGRLRQSQQDLMDQLALTSAAGSRDAPTPTTAIGLLSFLRAEDVGNLTLILQKEQAQVVAFVLSELDPKVGALVVSELPPALQTEAARRICVADRVREEVAQLTQQFVRERIEAMGPGRPREGIQTAVELLNLVNRTTEKHIIEELEQTDPELAEGVKRRMFVFEDITILDERSLATLLSEVDVDDLALALKTVGDDVRKLILAPIDEERRQVVEQREGQLGKVRHSDVEAAQQRVVSLTRKLEEEQRILVARLDEVVE